MGKLLIQPQPGVIHCEPYAFDDTTFKQAKTSAGDIQLSKVVAVGGGYIDDHGNKRESTCKAGDIIIHEYTPNTGDIEFDEFRFVKFFQVLSVVKEHA